MPVVVTDNQLDLIRLFYLLKSYKFQAPNIKYQLPKLKIQNIFIARTLNLLYETAPKWHSFFFDQTGRLRPAAVLV
jgi:hypothetical protein